MVNIDYYVRANYCGVILSIECARGKTCLRMTACCTATVRHACPNRAKISEFGYADDKLSAFSGPSKYGICASGVPTGNGELAKF